MAGPLVVQSVASSPARRGRSRSNSTTWRLVGSANAASVVSISLTMRLNNNRVVKDFQGNGVLSHATPSQPKENSHRLTDSGSLKHTPERTAVRAVVIGVPTQRKLWYASQACLSLKQVPLDHLSG